MYILQQPMSHAQWQMPIQHTSLPDYADIDGLYLLLIYMLLAWQSVTRAEKMHVCVRV